MHYIEKIVKLLTFNQLKSHKRTCILQYKIGESFQLFSEQYH